MSPLRHRSVSAVGYRWEPGTARGALREDRGGGGTAESSIGSTLRLASLTSDVASLPERLCELRCELVGTREQLAGRLKMTVRTRGRFLNSAMGRF